MKQNSKSQASTAADSSKKADGSSVSQHNAKPIVMCSQSGLSPEPVFKKVLFSKLENHGFARFGQDDTVKDYYIFEKRSQCGLLSIKAYLWFSYGINFSLETEESPPDKKFCVENTLVKLWEIQCPGDIDLVLGRLVSYSAHLQHFVF